MSSLEAQIATYLAHRMPEASGITVDELGRIYGGSSQETFRFRARWHEEGEAIDRRLILRRDATAGLVVAERDLEYNVYRALAGQGLPIPGVYFLELDAKWLDRPFFIMDLCPGKPGSPFVPTDPYDGHGTAIGEQYWSILGMLAAIDYKAVGLESLRNGAAPSGYWALELDRWEAILDENEALIEPAVRGAMRWLRRNPPPEPAKASIVHGDYRSGNFLFTEDGNISAILDWEMCHIGDPLEDVAWGLDPFWPITRHYPLDEGLARWEAASGIALDRAALDWWLLFTAVKACVIWSTAASGFASGKNREMTMALSGIRAGHFHRDLILKMMRTRGAMGLTDKDMIPKSPSPENLSPGNLSIDNALHGLEEFLRDRIAPAIKDPYVSPMARLSAMVMRICANGVDDAAELRVEENAAIRAILGEAAALLSAPFAGQLQSAATSTDPGLKISVLDAENHRLRVLLVTAQAALEDSTVAAARALDQRIWRLLETVEAKRAPRE